MLGYGQQVGSTHPTGMHYCFCRIFFNFESLCIILPLTSYYFSLFLPLSLGQFAFILTLFSTKTQLKATIIINIFYNIISPVLIQYIYQT